jgi:hypothetical protein
VTISRFWNYGSKRDIQIGRAHCCTRNLTAQLDKALKVLEGFAASSPAEDGHKRDEPIRKLRWSAYPRLDRYELVLGAAIRNHAASSPARDRFLVKARNSEIGRLNTCSRTASGSNDKWWQTHVRLPIDLSLEANQARADFATRSGPERSCTA